MNQRFEIRKEFKGREPAIRARIAKNEDGEFEKDTAAERVVFSDENDAREKDTVVVKNGNVYEKGGDIVIIGKAADVVKNKT